ncbi:MAG: hypothetical protein KDE53_15910, partial [Caldilineaceae bacterium]|nr:hypothetical protein [Caldilineaceae bacterium]
HRLEEALQRHAMRSDRPTFPEGTMDGQATQVICRPFREDCDVTTPQPRLPCHQLVQHRLEEALQRHAMRSNRPAFPEGAMDGQATKRSAAPSGKASTSPSTNQPHLSRHQPVQHRLEQAL